MYRVVEFEVEPMSVDHSQIKFEGDICNFPDNAKPQMVGHTRKKAPNRRSLVDYFIHLVSCTILD